MHRNASKKLWSINLVKLGVTWWFLKKREELWYSNDTYSSPSKKHYELSQAVPLKKFTQKLHLLFWGSFFWVPPQKQPKQKYETYPLPEPAESHLEKEVNIFFTSTFFRILGSQTKLDKKATKTSPFVMSSSLVFHRAPPGEFHHRGIVALRPRAPKAPALWHERRSGKGGMPNCSIMALVGKVLGKPLRDVKPKLGWIISMIFLNSFTLWGKCRRFFMDKQKLLHNFV